MSQQSTIARALPRRPALAKIGDDRRRRDDFGRLDGEQIGIAGADADAIEAAERGHSMSLASALTAAAAIALPPLRPRMTMAGRPLSISASFDSAAPTKPTGMPMIAAGRGAPADDHLEQTKQRGRRIADGDHRAAEPRQPELDRRRGARRAELRGEFGRGRIAERADHVIVRRQACARDPFGDHARIAKDRRAGAKRLARRLRGARREDEVAGRLHHAAGVDDPHRDPFFDRRETREVGLAANDREGAAIDRRSVLLVCVARLHDRLSRREHARALARREVARPRRSKGRAAHRRIASPAGQE